MRLKHRCINFYLFLLLLISPLLASDVINQRQDSMQDFNKLMRAANQSLKNGEIEGLSEIYDDIEVYNENLSNSFSR